MLWLLGRWWWLLWGVSDVWVEAGGGVLMGWLVVQVVEFADALAAHPQSFLAFPVGEEVAVLDSLSAAQESHARTILERSHKLSSVRYMLCPRRMDETRFWTVYFALLRNMVDGRRSAGEPREQDDDAPAVRDRNVDNEANIRKAEQDDDEAREELGEPAELSKREEPSGYLDFYDSTANNVVVTGDGGSSRGSTSSPIEDRENVAPSGTLRSPEGQQSPLSTSFAQQHASADDELAEHKPVEAPDLSSSLRWTTGDYFAAAESGAAAAATEVVAAPVPQLAQLTASGSEDDSDFVVVPTSARAVMSSPELIECPSS
eukprot:TRINITY_DN66852_c2_g2_i2.p2 TRINITY_DN66852_c2_g2~~TRINITY_DN66852_c2_g2_i2.p2  ORF type:complete len:317 (+),score=150.05 TRINITY_DN66852_c2_g2_i2:215-1165(+)